MNLLRLSADLHRWFFRPAISTCFARLQLSGWGCSVGSGLRVSGRLHLYIAGNVTIGDDVRFNSGAANFVGASDECWMWVGRKGRLKLGNRCGISNSTICAFESISIGEDAVIGGGCFIADGDFHPLSKEARIRNDASVPTAPVKIGKAAFVASRCIILKGVEIGEGSVIGSGSVVTRSVPAGELWAGTPARLIRKL